MTTTTPSPYAHILRAIADGEKNFQVNPLLTNGKWNDRTAEQMLEIIQHGYVKPEHMRVRLPPTVLINGIDVPEPLRELPPEGTEVFWPAWGPEADDMTQRIEVGYYPEMLPVLLLQGLLHLTQQAASKHAQALISFTISK